MSIDVRATQMFARDIRIETLKALGNLGFGHVGGSMSIADLLAVLYNGVMKIDPKHPEMEERDFFVLSKGHSGPALYAALALKGYFDKEELSTINQGGTRLPSHCDRNKTPGIDMCTGSLGQGMSTAIGLALACKMDKKDNYTYLVLGDGECDEGQVWEGALFAPQHKLDNLIVFIDYNKQQLDGYTKDILDLGDIRQKFEEFGWFTKEVDGANCEELYEAITVGKQQIGKPCVIVMNTKKGKDCAFAEDVLYNHHMTFSNADIDHAITQLEHKF